MNNYKVRSCDGCPLCAEDIYESYCNHPIADGDIEIDRGDLPVGCPLIEHGPLVVTAGE